MGRDSFLYVFKKLKKKHTYEKKKKDIHMDRITATVGCQQIDLLVFLNLIKQSAGTSKTKI